MEEKLKIKPIRIPLSIRGEVASVATRVPTPTSASPKLLRSNLRKSFSLISRITAPITVAPRIELGRCSNRNINGRARRTNAPVIAPAHVDVAPAKRFNALRPNDPPTGNA